MRIGDRCKVEAFAFLPPGVVLEDDVFVSHACLTNDQRPRATGGWEKVTTVVRRGARHPGRGAGSTAGRVVIRPWNPENHA